LSQWQARLLRLLNIQPGEAKLVGIVLVYAILLYASNVLAHTAGYALFLSAFNAATLPFAYLGISIVAPLITGVYLRLNRRFALSTVLIIVHAFLLLSLAAYGLTLGTSPASWLLFSLPIYFGVNNSLTIASFWNLLGRIFNLQQGKRLFGLLSSSEHLATIGAGFLTPLLISRLGTTNLFWVAALLMALTLAALAIIVRQKRTALIGPEDSADEGQIETRGIFAGRYVRLIVGLFALFIVGIYFVDNIFFSQVELRYTNENELASFIAIFFAVFGVLSLIVQIFIAGRVITRFGVRAMVLATPAGLLVIMVPFVLVGTFTAWMAALFWLIVAANMYRSVLDAVDSAAVNVMYQPLPPHQRTQAQTVVVGIVYPISIGVAGLLLLFFSRVLGFTPVMLAYVLLVILVVWLWTAFQLGRAYQLQVRQALTQRIFTGDRRLPLDESSLQAVRQGLASPHVGVVLYALDTLTETTPDIVAEVLPDLLGHPMPEIRQEALQRIEQGRLMAVLPAVRRRIPEETSVAVRATALRVVAALDEAVAIEEFLVYLEDEVPEIRQETLVGLLRNSGNQVYRKALSRLVEWAESPIANMRVMAAQVIGQVGGGDLWPVLEPLLMDSDLLTRRVAIAAAGQAGYERAWPSVVDAVADRRTRRVAAAALIEGGEATIPFIYTAFDRADQDETFRQQLVRIGGRIGGPATIAFLLENLNHPDDMVRKQVLAALNLTGFQAGAGQRGLIEQQIRSEAGWATGTIAALVDLMGDPHQEELSLLLSGLRAKVSLHNENIFNLLSFIYDPGATRRAWKVLRISAGDGEDVRSYALETLDVMLAKDLKAILVPLIDSQSPAEQLSRLKPYFPQNKMTTEQRLLALLDGPSRWLQLCALYSVGRMTIADEMIRQRVAQMALDEFSSPLVKEASAWALTRSPGVAVERLIAGTDDPLISEEVDTALPTMVRVENLFRAPFFAQTPEDVLLDVADEVAEIRVGAGESIFARDDIGDSMYIVVSGQIRIHDGTRTFNFQGVGDVFGEMALLEAQPRSASATAVESSHLLKLDREPFDELMEAYTAINLGIIRLLSRYLRASVAKLAEANTEVLPDISAAVPHVQDEFNVLLAPDLAPVERLMLLKRVDLFRRMPVEVLTELVFLMHESRITSGERIFKEGEVGDALYIIARGQVEVRAGNRILNYLQEGQVFGEMALLDSEPRLASVTAVEPTHLLRMDQAPFYEMLEDRYELAEGIIQNLLAHLRNRVKDLSERQAE
jgi:CRP-like cAMP-binding protein/HEAT repeat protein